MDDFWEKKTKLQEANKQPNGVDVKCLQETCSAVVAWRAEGGLRDGACKYFEDQMAAFVRKHLEGVIADSQKEDHCQSVASREELQEKASMMLDFTKLLQQDEYMVQARKQLESAVGSISRANGVQSLKLEISSPHAEEIENLPNVARLMDSCKGQVLSSDDKQEVVEFTTKLYKTTARLLAAGYPSTTEDHDHLCTAMDVLEASGALLHDSEPRAFTAGHLYLVVTRDFCALVKELQNWRDYQGDEVHLSKLFKRYCDLRGKLNEYIDLACQDSFAKEMCQVSNMQTVNTAQGLVASPLIEQIKAKITAILLEALSHSNDELNRYNGGSRKSGELWSKKLSEHSSLAEIRKQGEATVAKCFGDKITSCGATLVKARERLKTHLENCGVSQPEKEHGYEILTASAESWMRGLATEFECRLIGAWDLTGAGRVKTFDKIINKLQTDAGTAFSKVKDVILPQLLSMAYEGAERDATGLKMKKKAPTATVNSAPPTPSMPVETTKASGSAGSAVKDKKNAKEQEHDKDAKKAAKPKKKEKKDKKKKEKEEKAAASSSSD